MSCGAATMGGMMEEKPHTKVYDWAIEEAGTIGGCIHGVILRFSDDSRVCHATMGEMCKLIGVNQRMFLRTVQKLKKLGMVDDLTLGEGKNLRHLVALDQGDYYHRRAFGARPDWLLELAQEYEARRTRRGILNLRDSEEWKAICESFNNRCARCGEERPLEMDHVIPVSRGGPEEFDNIQPLCKSCNCQKSNKPGWDFRPIMVPYEELEAAWA